MEIGCAIRRFDARAKATSEEKFGIDHHIKKRGANHLHLSRG